MDCLKDTLVLVKGAGDLGSGVAARLFRVGLPVVMTELAQPLALRRKVSFGEAVYEGRVKVEGIVAQRVGDVAAARRVLAEGAIPVIVDPAADSRHALQPAVLVDAVMAKRNTGTALADAPLVVALGPGFLAGADCHAVIETNRGHWLGRVIWKGAAQPDTGVPGAVHGKDSERVLRAPVTGYLQTMASICDRVTTGQLVATVHGHPVLAQIDGVVRGLARDGLAVRDGLKIGDIDPRAEPVYCSTISDKSLAVAGGVLEAILAALCGSRRGLEV
jgi:xanthine dehydrogenase accessory factor